MALAFQGNFMAVPFIHHISHHRDCSKGVVEWLEVVGPGLLFLLLVRRTRRINFDCCLMLFLCEMASVACFMSRGRDVFEVLFAF